MKRAVWIFLVFLVLGATVSFAETCEECPPRATADGEIMLGGTCMGTRAAGDGCNRCSFETWCIDGQWYRSNWEMCTLALCGAVGFPIENPFGK